MSASTAIGRVSQSLRSLLQGEMNLPPVDPFPVTILAPDEQGGQERLNLFLYKVQEHPFLRNQDWQVSPANSSQLSPPPLSLSLYYLITPFGRNDNQLGNARSHEILGEAMRVFHQFPIIPDLYLASDLDEAREQIKIMHNGVDMEELSQVWSTFSEPFRLSVLYEVSVVQLDHSTVANRPMPQRVREIGVPDIQAPFAPPRLLRIDPISGPAGSTITFEGKHLDGWNAYVSVLREPLEDGLEISGDQFPVTLPAVMEPGFYQLRADISHLHRQTFFFEVTA